MTDNNEKILDPETGEEVSTSQFEGDKSLDEECKSKKGTEGGNDGDEKYVADTENRHTTHDEAGFVSAPSAEGRRTRIDEVSENPSEDK